MRPFITTLAFTGALVTAGSAAPRAWQTPAATPASTAMPAATDPRVAEIIKEISPARIKEIDDKLVSFGTRVSTSESISTDTRGAVPARKWIVSQFQAISDANGGRLKVSVDTFPIPKGSRIPEDQTMSNVVAVLPGTDPNDKRIFVVSGHYDSLPADFAQDGPGANDDASGTIVSMECARALSKYQFPATIEFLTVEGEEQGLYGSKHAADAAKAAGEDIPAMLNNDIVGGDQTPGHENRDLLRVFSEGIPAKATPQQVAQIAANSLEDDSPSREVARYASSVAAAYLPGFQVVLEYRPDRFQRGGDQESFVSAGFPAVRFTEFNENSNHQHLAVHVQNGVEIGDLGKWISPDFIANVARVNALTLASLASAPASPEHVYFQAGQQVGTAITWTEVPGAASYRVLMRPTSESQWTIRRPAPAVLAPARGAGAGGRGGARGAGTAGTTAAPPAGQAAAAPPPAPPAEPAAPMFQITVPESGDNYFFAIVAVDAAGHESLPRLAGTAPRGGGRRGGGHAPELD